MKYLNKKNGRVVDVESKLSGDWKLLEESETPETPSIDKKSSDDEVIDLNKLNKDQIKAVLDEEGIEYTDDLTKAQLIELYASESGADE